MRPRPAAPRALFFVVLGLALLTAGLLAAGTAGAAGQGAQVGRYLGSTEQQRSVAMRIAEQNGKLVIATFESSIKVECPGAPEFTSTFGPRPDAAIDGDDRVSFKVGDNITVSMFLVGELAHGKIDYAGSGCHDSFKFTAYLQPPDPIVQAGRYVGTFHRETYALTVAQKRGYFEVTNFDGVAETCDGKKLGVDVSPTAFIDVDGLVDFTALSGRVKVALKFHHKSHVEGRITYADGKCSETIGFAARLKPAT